MLTTGRVIIANNDFTSIYFFIIAFLKVYIQLYVSLYAYMSNRIKIRVWLGLLIVNMLFGTALSTFRSPWRRQIKLKGLPKSNYSNFHFHSSFLL